MKAPDIYDTASWHAGYGQGYGDGQKVLREKMEWNKYLADERLAERAYTSEAEHNEPYRKVLLEVGRRLRAVASEMEDSEDKDEFLRLAKWCRRLHEVYQYSPQDFFAFIEDKEYPL